MSNSTMCQSSDSGIKVEAKPGTSIVFRNDSCTRQAQSHTMAPELGPILESQPEIFSVASKVGSGVRYRCSVSGRHFP